MNTRTKHIGVIGAGMVGVSTAIWLQRAGYQVTLIDKIGPAAGASFGNGGVLAACASVPVTVPGILKKAPGMLLNKDAPLFLKWGYLPKLMPWLIKYLSHANEEDVYRIARAVHAVVGDSLDEHQQLSAGTEAAKLIVPCDYYYLYEDRAAYEKDKLGWAIRKHVGIEWEELEGSAFSNYDDCFSGQSNFAAKMGNHGRITDPGQYVTELANHFVSQGGDLKICDVSGFEFEDDRVSLVRTNLGNLAFDDIAITAGVWSKALTDALGVNVPLESERGYHIELWEPNFMPKSPVMNSAGKFVITPMDGRIRLAGIVEFGGLKAGRSRAPFDLLLKNVKAAIPGLQWKRKEEWMGHRPAPTDSIPLIGRAPRIKNAWMGFGHHHIGLTAGPKTGRLLSQMIGGVKSNLDLAQYDPIRFDT